MYARGQAAEVGVLMGGLRQGRNKSPFAMSASLRRLERGGTHEERRRRRRPERDGVRQGVHGVTGDS